MSTLRAEAEGADGKAWGWRPSPTMATGRGGRWEGPPAGGSEALQSELGRGGRQALPPPPSKSDGQTLHQGKGHIWVSAAGTGREWPISKAHSGTPLQAQTADADNKGRDWEGWGWERGWRCLVTSQDSCVCDRGSCRLLAIRLAGGYWHTSHYLSATAATWVCVGGPPDFQNTLPTLSQDGLGLPKARGWSPRFSPAHPTLWPTKVSLATRLRRKCTSHDPEAGFSTNRGAGPCKPHSPRTRHTTQMGQLNGHGHGHDQPQQAGRGRPDRNHKQEPVECLQN